MERLSGVTGNTQEVGRWFWGLSKATNVQEAERKCYNWYQQQLDINLQRLLWPCPCSILQAWRDGNFRFDWRNYYFYPSSYRQCRLLHTFLRPRFNITLFNTESNEYMRAYVILSQRCCYSTNREDYGSLLKGPRDGGHARVKVYLYNRNRIPGLLNDDEAHWACCRASNLCHLFYEKRPSDTCKRYKPPIRRKLHL